VRQTGDYPETAEVLEAAFGIYHDVGDRGGEAEVLDGAGMLYRVCGDLVGPGLVTGRPWTWLMRSAAPGMRPRRWPA
jgi:hypothetical protein